MPWAWAVNGFFTVIGSVSAMILAMAFGFAAVHIIAAACYVVALLAIRTGTMPHKMIAHVHQVELTVEQLTASSSDGISPIAI